MWRAADDASDLNYIEVLLELLQAHPDRDLQRLASSMTFRMDAVSASSMFLPPSRKGKQRPGWLSFFS